MSARRREPVPLTAALRRTLLWSAAAFIGLGVAGFALVPRLSLVWVIVIVFGVAAVPQAFRRTL